MTLQIQYVTKYHLFYVLWILHLRNVSFNIWTYKLRDTMFIQ